MVGTEKYSSEQILFILQSKDNGFDNHTIANECRKKWRNRQFETNGIKYVWTKHNRAPEYIDRASRPVFAAAASASVPGLSQFQQQALAQYLQSRPAAADFFRQKAQSEVAAQYHQAHPNNNAVPSTPSQRQEQVHRQGMPQHHQSQPSSSSIILNAPSPQRQQQQTQSQAVAHNNTASMPSLQRQQQAQYQGAAPYHQTNNFASPTISSLQRQRQANPQVTAQHHRGNPTNASFIPSLQRQQDFGRQVIPQHDQSQSLPAFIQSTAVQHGTQQAQRPAMAQYASAQPAAAPMPSTVHYGQQQFQRQPRAHQGRGKLASEEPNADSAKVAARVALQSQPGPQYSKPLRYPTPPPPPEYNPQQGTAQQTQLQPASMPSSSTTDQYYQMQSRPQYGAQYHQEQPTSAKPTSSPLRESTELSTMTPCHQIQPAYTKTSPSTSSQLPFKGTNESTFSRDHSERQSREQHKVRQMQQTSMSHKNSMSGFNPAAVRPQVNARYHQALPASASTPSAAKNLYQQQVNPQVIAQHQQEHRGYATTSYCQPQTRGPSQQFRRVQVPAEDIYKAQRDFMHQLAGQQPTGPTANTGPPYSLLPNNEQLREELFAEQRTLHANLQAQTMSQLYSNNYGPAPRQTPQFRPTLTFQPSTMALNDASQNDASLNSGSLDNALHDNVLLENAPLDSPLLHDLPLDDLPINNAPIDNAPIDNAPIDNAPINNAPLDKAPLDKAPLDMAPLDDASLEYFSLDSYLMDDGPLDETLLDEFFFDTESSESVTPSVAKPEKNQAECTRLSTPTLVATPEKQTKSIQLPTPPTEKKRKAENKVDDEPAAKRQQHDATIIVSEKLAQVSGEKEVVLTSTVPDVDPALIELTKAEMEQLMVEAESRTNINKLDDAFMESLIAKFIVDDEERRLEDLEYERRGMDLPGLEDDGDWPAEFNLTF